MQVPPAAAAAAVAVAKKTAHHKAVPNKEDPRHTWNQQLMEACLSCDLTKVKELVERGADPVNAREAPPLSFFIGALGKTVQEQQQQRQEKRSTEDSGNCVVVLEGGGGGDGGTHGEGYRGYDGASRAGDGNSINHTAASPATAAAAVSNTNGASAGLDRLPPLAAMLLSGLDTPAARSVIAFLLECGASVNDTFTFAATREDGMESDAPNAAGGGDDASARGAHPTSVEVRKSAAKKKMSAVGSRSNSTVQATGAAAGAAATAGSGNAETCGSSKGEVNRVVEGTLLHYVVNRSDHAQLLRLLLLAGPPSPFKESTHHLVYGSENENISEQDAPPDLPYSLLNAVEQETVVGALWHQQLDSLLQSERPMSGSKASAEESTSVAGGSVSQQQQQHKSKGRQGAGTSSSTHIASGPVSPSHTMPLNRDTAAAAAAGTAFTISPAAAEAVLAAFQQRLQQQPTSLQSGSAAGVVSRRLPVLISAYPQFLEEGGIAGPSVAALHNATAPLWNLRGLCGDWLQSNSQTSKGNDGGDAKDDAGSNKASTLMQRIQMNLTAVDSEGYTAATIALYHGDTLSVRLLHFFGAAIPFHSFVNATQTRLARACAQGDVARVEYLLDQGDRLAQISADGRYTLIHYAAAQPAVLKVLTEHGLSLEYENVWGESAVLSLLRHGTARNDAKYVQTLYGTAAAAGGGGTEGANTAMPPYNHTVNTTASANAQTPPANAPLTAAVSNAIAFTQLPPSAQRNYILCPPLQLPLLTVGVNGGGVGGASGNSGRAVMAKERSTSTTARRASANQNAGATGTTAAPASQLKAARQQQSPDELPEQPFLGGRESGTWWSFLSPVTTTAEVVDTLLKAGAVLQGYVPDEDLDLPYVRFAEGQANAAAANVNDGLGASAEYEEGEEYDDASYYSRASLSGSANTAAPLTAHSSYIRLKNGTLLAQRPQPFPGRLPLRLTPLQQAIFDYHPELIKRLVMDYRVDPMQRDSQGATAVHYAALCSHAPSVLELLLSPQVMLMHVRPGSVPGSGSGGGGGNISNNTAASAVSGEAVISIPAAIGSKIDLNCIDMAGRTPLFYAALVGNVEAVKLILRFGALAQVGRADCDGWTPLHVAVRQEHPEVVELLLRHTTQLLSGTSNSGGVVGGAAGGRDFLTEMLLANPGATASAGVTVSNFSWGSGRRTSSRCSGRRGSALCSGSITSGSVGRVRRLGSNPVFTAASAIGASAADLLFANGGMALVDVEAEERSSHMTALEMLIKQVRPHQPASATQLRIAAALLAEGQASSMRPSGLPSGGLLLHRVVADGQVELAELLLSYYADPEDVDDRDETPLFIAVRHAVASSTLSCPEDATKATIAGEKEESQQELQLRKRCRASLVRVLLQYGATPFAQSGTNLETPLHLAARSLAVETDDVEELLQLLFYTAPDRKAAGAVGGHNGNSGGRRLWSDRRGKSGENRIASRSLDTLEGESHQMSRRGSRWTVQQQQNGGGGARENALRRRLNRNNNENSGRTDLRQSSLEASGRDRRSLLPSQQQQQRRTGQPQQQASSEVITRVPSNTSGSSARRKMGADDLGDVTDSAADDQLSIANSSLASAGINTSAFAGEEDRIAVTSEPESPESSMTALHMDNARSEGEIVRDARRVVVLRQWQVAEHLLTPSYCWMLTNSEGQTPLHVMCSSACRAVQRLPALLKLLADLQAATKMCDPANISSDVLTTLWGLPDAHGRTPLHAAAQSGFVEAMEVILQMSPASVVAVDAQGRTPLHACVLMTRHMDRVTSAGVTAAEMEGEEGEAQQTEQLHRMMQTLRDALAKLSADGKTVLLQGQPIRRAGCDVLPTPFNTDAATAFVKSPGRVCGFDCVDTSPHTARTRAVAALVQPSTITEQLQRWQKTRHWGAPALIRNFTHDEESDEFVNQYSSSNGGADLRMDAAVLPGGVRDWRAYTQLPDGQGRTALLLAAEVGNRSAARALLRQA